MDYYRIANALLSHTAAARSRWYELARKVHPRMIPAAMAAENTMNANGERLCYKARSSAFKLASAHTDYITPMGQKWFQFCSWLPEKDVSADDADWYAKATSIAQRELESSNFYTEMNSVYIDRVITGTGLMMVEGRKQDGSLVFEHVPAGTYALAQNAAHEVNVVVRVLRMKASEVEEMWGEEALTPAMRISWLSDDRRYEEEFEVWHLVCPRKECVPALNDVMPELRPFASVYIDPSTKQVLYEDGCYEFPFMCTRFLRSGSQVYGDSALAGLEDVMHDREVMAEIMMVAGQKIAFPPVVAMGEQADEVDMRGGGVTIVSPEAAQYGYPRLLGAAGEYRVGLDMLERLDNEIETALFIDMLQIISSAPPRAMTATEVQARESERVLSFSSSFMQHVSDFRPCMNRIFCLLVRAGKFDMARAPEGLVQPVQMSAGGVVRETLALSPKVAYVGKMSQALAAAQTGTVLSLVRQALDLAAATNNPAWLDKIDEDKVVDEVLKNANIPYSITRSQAEVKRRRDARDKAALAAQQAEVAAKLGQAGQSGANAAETLSRIRPQ